MAKKTVKKPAAVAAPIIKQLPNDFLYNRRLHIIFLLVLSLGLYINTVVNEYALDDMIVITSNSFTKKGFEGLSGIMFKDSFVGYTGMENQLAGGRYRPLSIASFAIEVGLFGQSPHISHFINVLLYVVLILQLYFFLESFVFKGNLLATFLATLLFAIHPIHTEVVANIKSRDEIMCFSFMLLSLHLYFSHLLQRKNTLYLILAMLCYFLSLLSKESSLIYIAVAPLLLYYFNGKKLPAAIKAGLPYFAVVFFYFIVRVKLTGFKMVENGEILNAYYMRATKSQAFATKIYLMGKYLIMLVWPWPMSYDYSFNHFKYVNTNDGRFLLSFFINMGILIYGFVKMPTKSMLSFAILFYFMNMSLVTNFVFDVGTPMADRFLFYPSLSLALVLAYYGVRWVESADIKVRLNITKALAVCFLLLCVPAVIARNIDWKSENNLFTADVNTCPGSAKTNSNCGVALINISGTLPNDQRLKMLQEAIDKLHKSVAIHPGYVDAWINMGVAYSRLNDVEHTQEAWLKVRELSPAHPRLPELMGVLGGMWFNKAMEYNKAKNYAESAAGIEKAIAFGYPNKVDAYYNLGGNYLMAGNVAKAREAWTQVLTLNPNHAEAKKWLAQIANMK